MPPSKEPSWTTLEPILVRLGLIVVISLHYIESGQPPTITRQNDDGSNDLAVLLYGASVGWVGGLYLPMFQLARLAEVPFWIRGAFFLLTLMRPWAFLWELLNGFAAELERWEEEENQRLPERRAQGNAPRRQSAPTPPAPAAAAAATTTNKTYLLLARVIASTAITLVLITASGFHFICSPGADPYDYYCHQFIQNIPCLSSGLRSLKDYSRVLHDDLVRLLQLSSFGLTLWLSDFRQWAVLQFLWSADVLTGLTGTRLAVSGLVVWVLELIEGQWMEEDEGGEGVARQRQERGAEERAVVLPEAVLPEQVHVPAHHPASRIRDFDEVPQVPAQLPPSPPPSARSDEVVADNAQQPGQNDDAAAEHRPVEAARENVDPRVVDQQAVSADMRTRAEYLAHVADRIATARAPADQALAISNAMADEWAAGIALPQLSEIIKSEFRLLSPPLSPAERAMVRFTLVAHLQSDRAKRRAEQRVFSAWMCQGVLFARLKVLLKRVGVAAFADEELLSAAARVGVHASREMPRDKTNPDQGHDGNEKDPDFDFAQHLPRLVQALVLNDREGGFGKMRARSQQLAEEEKTARRVHAEGGDHEQRLRCEWIRMEKHLFAGLVRKLEVGERRERKERKERARQRRAE
ncbi:hypothetical protein IWZ00DRAFT_546236 [Phyllosticta capitalensis]|uniref:uncharacterized protein n=1 Tax=Phyllosticta capitalensis TaxID=121624 RepID=UPI00312F3BFF